MADWSAPDAAGIRTLRLDVGAQATLRGRRRRRAERLDLHSAAAWPAEWHALAREWLAGSPNPRWATLLKIAGHGRRVAATELLDALLRHGWIEVEEDRGSGGVWSVQRLRFLDFEAQRERLGLANRAHQLAELARLREPGFEDEGLAVVALALQDTNAPIALRRLRWLRALDAWRRERRAGTRRDFALFASGDTKGVPAADWSWLDAALDLGEYGVDPHTPLLLVRAPLRLGALELRGLPDFIGLTPALIAAAGDADGEIHAWRLVENRTSFERASRAYGARDAVVWLPGQPPGWWREALGRLLALRPAPALIAADPDPAGIVIARAAGSVWESAGLAWSPWRMDAGVLDELPARRPLTEADRALLDALLAGALPEPLRGLAQAMLRCNAKGEQEGLKL